MATHLDDAPVALLLENVHPNGEAMLTEAGYSVQTVTRALDEDELIERLPGVQVLGLRSKSQITERVLAADPDLLAVGAFCIGTNQIDLPAATERGIAVFNAPYSNTRSVVEMAIAEIIMLIRRLPDKNTGMHAGQWDKSATGAHEVRGRTLGIIGYGNIGSQLSVVAESLGLRVCFFDTVDKLSLGNAHRCGTMEELLAQADVVTLHVDGRPGNSGLFGEDLFAAMKPGAIFLNLSRGFVVDHSALRAHLESGHLAGAAVDVFPTEPKGAGEEFVSELRGLPNVILTPHIGGSTEEAQADIGTFVGGKLRDYVETGATTLSVNLPTLTLPAVEKATRIVHLHRNVPGVLAEINGLLARSDVNVEGQLLGTRGDIGYVITDISTDRPGDLTADLEGMQTTIRLRLLR